MVSTIYDPNGLMPAKANYAAEELIVADIKIGKPTGCADFADDVYELRRVQAK